MGMRLQNTFVLDERAAHAVRLYKENIGVWGEAPVLLKAQGCSDRQMIGSDSSQSRAKRGHSSDPSMRRPDAV